MQFESEKTQLLNKGVAVADDNAPIGLEEDEEDDAEKEIATFVTPDFLIKSKLKINQKEVNWIDAKNYFGGMLFLWF